MRRGPALWLLPLVAGLLWSAPPAQACSFEPRSVEENLSRSDAVFVGVIASTDQIGRGPITATLAVTEVFKGDVPQTVSVRTEATTKRCGVPFVPGASYTVMAVTRDGSLWADLRRGTSEDGDALARAGLRPTVVYTYTEGSGIAALLPESNVRAGRGGLIAAAILLLVTVAIATVIARRIRRGDWPPGRTV